MSISTKLVQLKVNKITSLAFTHK